MTAPRLGIADVKPLLQGRAGELARLLLPGGRKEAGRWQGHDPKAGGKDNFTIWTSGPAAGAFKAWARGVSGDVIDLLIELDQARDRREALAWAKGWLGLEDAPPAKIKAIRAAALNAEARTKRQDAEKEARRTAYAKAVWLSALPMRRGDAAWNYLEIERGIPMGWLAARKGDRDAGPSGAVRFHPDLDYHRPQGAPSRHPAMVSVFSPILTLDEACQSGPGGLHRTYLAARGEGKANVPSPKRMHGSIRGCAIKIWRGEGLLSERAAIERGHLIPCALTEGIEDGFSVAAACPELRVMTLGSLSQFANMPWPACASELVICADNDWDKPEAQALLMNAASRLAAFGPVRVAKASREGVKDMNDLLNASRRQS